jgi:hypothetical protein
MPGSDPLRRLNSAYEAVKSHCARNCRSAQAGIAICHLATLSLEFLIAECSQVNLISRVSGKEYIAFRRGNTSNVLSRPANRQMFLLDKRTLEEQWQAWSNNQGDGSVWKNMSYTVALAPCLAMEIFDRQNKKGPATYFECLIGHIFAKALGINPRKQTSFRIEGRAIRLTMDFLFDRPGGVRVHLPVKMSTRERVVQAWSHQRILEGAFGEGTYKGIMVLFSETKLDSRNHEVVEICVPDQWLVYQKLLAKIDRIYYFDLPLRYKELTETYPNLIQIREFAQFFIEKGVLLGV